MKLWFHDPDACRRELSVQGGAVDKRDLNPTQASLREPPMSAYGKRNTSRRPTPDVPFFPRRMAVYGPGESFREIAESFSAGGARLVLKSSDGCVVRQLSFE